MGNNHSGVQIFRVMLSIMNLVHNVYIEKNIASSTN